MKDNYNIYVSVEQRHIDAGIRTACCHCPIALALNECLAANFHARVGGFIDIEYSERNLTQYSALAPAGVVDFMNQFDGGKPMKPFVFTLWSVPTRLIKF